MKRLKKSDYRNIALLYAALTLFLLILTRFEYYFGSNTDWVNQHCVIPQYYRTLFYDTHDLFPDFAFNIGGGQNIYYLAYYGFLSPLILPSYLLPFVPMRAYIVAVSIISLFVSCFLFYKWIRQRLSEKATLMFTFMFLFAAPLIYHSHRHIMFVNYMPFLLLALIAVDRYYLTKRKTLLTVCAFLIVMTSFYYSVGAFAAILIYAAFVSLEKSGGVKVFFADIAKVGFCLAIALLMSAVLTIPTFYALLNGRSEANHMMKVALFIPRMDFANIMYQPYSIGLTAFSFAALVLGVISPKKPVRFLCVILCLLCFMPLSLYILSGKMYFDAKVLIPLLPVVLIATAELYTLIRSGQYPMKKYIIICTVCAVVAVVSTILDKNSAQLDGFVRALLCLLFVAEMLILLFCVIQYRKQGKRKFLFIPIVIIEFAVCFSCNISDSLVRFDSEAIKLSDDIDSAIQSALENDGSFYRIGNLISTHDTVNEVYCAEDYQTTIYSSARNRNFSNFYFSIMYNENSYRNSALTTQTTNYLFNTFMGNKYIVAKKGDEDRLAGYKKVGDYGDVTLWKTEYAFPVGYSSPMLMSAKRFSELEYPYNIDALMNYIIVDEPVECDYKTNIDRIALTRDDSLPVDIAATQNGSRTEVILTAECKQTCRFTKPVESGFIMIRFKVDNDFKENKGDIWIDINGTRNMLTKKGWKYHNKNYSFEYVIYAEKPTDSLELVFSNGRYGISGLEIYTIPRSDIRDTKEDRSEYIIDREKTAGDIIYGTINAESDGCFMLSVPHDEGFTVELDGKKVEHRRLSTGFIGFDIKRGEHTVIIGFDAPMKKAGVIVSLVGIVLFTSIAAVDIASAVRKRTQSRRSENENANISE